MQDWEYEVADSKRINEFLEAYESGELTEDEKFTLMETIIQSFEDLGPSVADHPSWGRVLRLLDDNIDLHIYTVWYWSCPESRETWNVSQYLCEILSRHRKRFEKNSIH
jgi:hypothetical protein